MFFLEESLKHNISRFFFIRRPSSKPKTSIFKEMSPPHGQQKGSKSEFQISTVFSKSRFSRETSVPKSFSRIFFCCFFVLLLATAAAAKLTKKIGGSSKNDPPEYAKKVLFGTPRGMPFLGYASGGVRGPLLDPFLGPKRLKKVGGGGRRGGRGGVVEEEG